MSTMNAIFNAQPRVKSYRDIQLGSVQKPIEYPKEYKSDISWLKPLYQNGYPMCGAHAGAHLKMGLDYYDNKNIISYSPVSLWKLIKRDGTDPNEGTGMDRIFSCLKKFGICDWSLLPTDYTKDLYYLSKNDLTQEQLDNAQPKIIRAYAYGKNDVDSIKRDVFVNKFMLILLDVGNTWWGQEIVYKPTKIYGGHFVTAYGYDENYIYIIDSADNGIPLKRLPFYVTKIRETGTAIDIPNEEVEKLTKQIKSLRDLINKYKK